MIEAMEGSQGNMIGFRAIGKIEPEDYRELVPMVEELIREEGDIRVLMDLSDFKSEAVSAWGADLRFGREFHDGIDRLAIVGDKHWEKWMTELCAPFYAREAKYFHTRDISLAWEWLKA